MQRVGIVSQVMVTGLLGLSGLALALDVADVNREWTPEGKKLAAERAKLPAHDDMVRVPAGAFTMGSDKRKLITTRIVLSFRSAASIWTLSTSISLRSRPSSS